MRAWVFVVIAACKSREAPCGDAIDEAFARRHAGRQTAARLDPARRDELAREQALDDRIAATRRAFYVERCVDDEWSADQRACAAEGDIEICLSNADREALSRDLTYDERRALYMRVVDRMCSCTTKVCADAVTDELARFGHDMVPDPDLSARLDACQARAMGADGPPPRSALPMQCERYRRSVEAYEACEKLPQESRDAIRQAFDAAMESWRDVGDMPPEALHAIDDACRAGADAIEQARAAIGCS